MGHRQWAAVVTVSMAVVAGTMSGAVATEPPDAPPAPVVVPTPPEESEPPPEDEVSPTAEEPPAPSEPSEPVVLATSTTLSPSSWTSMRHDGARGTVRVLADGKAAAGLRVTVTASGKRTVSQTVRTDASGRASYRMSLVPGTYRLVATTRADAAHRASSSTPVRVTVQKGRNVSLMINSGRDSVVRTGEEFWLRGTIRRSSGAAHAGAKVHIHRKKGKRWVRSATVRADSQGRFSWSPPRRTAGLYQARASSKRTSSKVRVAPSRGARTLASRTQSLDFILGTARGGVQQAGGRTWRDFSGGVLMVRGDRTWLVRGRLAKELRRRGPAGALGLPTGDARCGLPEKACLQQFTRGAIYSNPSARTKVTSAVASRTGAADLVAVALSQVGYREPSFRKSKYNKWMRATKPGDAWCGYFAGWLAHAAGKPNAVLKRNTFASLVAAERKRGRLHSKPAVGRLMYLGNRSRVYHVGIVTEVKGDRVRIVEGNVDPNGGNGFPRGVIHRWRSHSLAAFYADPYY